jgi:hypothetical protein
VRARTWAKTAVGLLAIGGVLGGLWAAYRPSVIGTVTATRPPPPPRLHQARAVVVVLSPSTPGGQRAVIACDGDRRTATGFWGYDAGAACDALASTRGPLLSGRGCRRTLPGRTRLHARGGFGPRRFDHWAQRGGCPDFRGWLLVNVLALPVLPVEQQLTDRAARGP